MRSVLIVIGLVVLSLTAIVWLAVDAKDSTGTVVETSTVTSTPSPGAPSATGKPASNTVSSKTTKTTNPAASRRTDAALALLVALGVAFVLVGAFFDRITSIEAAGVKVGLGARVTEAIAARTSPKTDEDRAKVRAAYWLAIERLRNRGIYDPPTSGGDDPVTQEAEAALRNVNADFE